MRAHAITLDSAIPILDTIASLCSITSEATTGMTVINKYHGRNGVSMSPVEAIFASEFIPSIITATLDAAPNPPIVLDEIRKIIELSSGVNIVANSEARLGCNMKPNVWPF